MTTSVWQREPQQTLVDLLRSRLDAEADAPYLDVVGTALTAADIADRAGRIAGGLQQMGVRKGDRVASLIENSPEALLTWWGVIWSGAVAVPVNTAYKGEYLRHQLADSGSKALVVQGDLADRAVRVVPDVDGLDHVVVIGDGPSDYPTAKAHDWKVMFDDGPVAPVDIRPSDLGTFIYTGGTTGLSKGCMLSHNYHAVLSRQIGTCWGRLDDDVVWTPLPLFHFNALVTAVIGPLIFGGRGAIDRKFSVSSFWSEMNRTGATITSTLGTMAYLLAHDVDRPEMPKSGSAEANTSLRLLGAAPLPEEIDTLIKSRFGIDTFSGAYGLTEASLVSWQPPGVTNKPNAAGVINTEYFDVRIFDDDDNELPRDTEGEIVIRPKRAHAMFEGYWGRPEATVEASRNWWFHTGDVGRVDGDDFLFFVDRKADYLRRRGENIASFEVERILMRHGELADVVVHAVFSELGEDDLKITATRAPESELSEADLFRWCIDELPYFALPRYIEFRDELPRSPVGRVLKRVLREQGVTVTTWSVDDSGISFEKR
jgi:crotonobetaine/carnitine-CoA ligase